MIESQDNCKIYLNIKLMHQLLLLTSFLHLPIKKMTLV